MHGHRRPTTREPILNSCERPCYRQAALSCVDKLGRTRRPVGRVPAVGRRWLRTAWTRVDYRSMTSWLSSLHSVSEGASESTRQWAAGGGRGACRQAFAAGWRRPRAPATADRAPAIDRRSTTQSAPQPTGSGSRSSRATWPQKPSPAMRRRPCEDVPRTVFSPEKVREAPGRENRDCQARDRQRERTADARNSKEG